MWQPKLVKAEEQQRVRRQERIDWMRRMYAQGSHATSASASDVPKADGDEEDLEADELLEWCDALDLDTYQAEWALLATTPTKY